MIREYRDEDLEAVLAAWATASTEAHPFLSEEFQNGVRHQIENVYLSMTKTWVWETDGSVVGFISLFKNEIGGLFLDPKFHGLGIGRALVDHACGLRDELDVEVFKDNVIGRTFYEKYGFVRTEEKVHVETGLDLLRLKFVVK